MGRRRRGSRLPSEPVEAVISSLSHEGRGVTRIENKATFVHGALPGEKVSFKYTSIKRSHDEGSVVEVLESSELRVEPECPHYDICGGCSLQHMAADEQIKAKQGVLLENLEHLGKVAAEEVLPPLTNDSPWGYRRKARLGVKHVPKKGKVLVGFRERGSSFIADLSRCLVLHPKVGELIDPLSKLIEGLSISAKIPQIEVAMDDEQCVLIFRHLESFTTEDEAALAAFGEEHKLSIYLQPGGPDTVAPLTDAVELEYHLPSHDVRLNFLPNDFTQVNTEINRKMVSRALQMLDVQENERVLDLFCGVGNFTLPLAKEATEVVGVEGDAGLVQRARNNAARNNLENVEFYTANLYEDLAQEAWMKQTFDKALLDPPRSGAFEVLEHLPKMGIKRIVYVSCYPGTLARDAGELVNKHGYRMISAGVMDMFPHTSHVESIALFEKS